MKHNAVLFAVSVTLVISLCPGGQAGSCRQTQQPAGSISGRVMKNDHPLAGVTVLVTPQVKAEDHAKVGSQGGTQTLKGTSDTDGHYLVTGLAACWYNVELSPSPVLDIGAEASEIAVGDGEAVANVDFRVQEGGVISGTVTNADGQPMIARPVILQRVHDPNDSLSPRLSIRYSFHTAETDDRGVYRAYGLVRGKYRVGADARSRQAEQLGSPRQYLTYYPGSSTAQEAGTVEVIAGAEVTGIDIKILPLRTASGLTKETSGAR